METGYFHRVHALSPTRFWVNNPTLAEAELAVAAGAVACTTNPTYAAKMLAAGADGSCEILQDAVKRFADDSEAAAHVQRRLAAGIMEVFEPVYRASASTLGFVSIQGDPLREDDPEQIVAEARRGFECGPSFIAKIPVTRAGLEAIEQVVAAGIPVIATEIMSIAQMVEACEAYLRASRASGRRPGYFVTHITGIFDEYLAKTVAAGGIEVSREALWYAGISVARRQLRVMRERSYPGVLLGGGARELRHFTEFVGGDVHVTINWRGTADRLVEENPPVVHRFGATDPERFIDELRQRLPDFGRAWETTGLSVDEFSEFGPVVHFRNMFVDGWRKLLDAVTQARR